jgi:hypothetical protein
MPARSELLPPAAVSGGDAWAAALNGVAALFYLLSFLAAAGELRSVLLSVSISGKFFLL